MISPPQAATSDIVRRLHSFPVGGDEPLHICSPACWCYPVRDKEQPLLWIHNASDCREAKERAGRTDLLAADSLWVLAFENVEPVCRRCGNRGQIVVLGFVVDCPECVTQNDQTVPTEGGEEKP
jgi:hypothetical protein